MPLLIERRPAVRLVGDALMRVNNAHFLPKNVGENSIYETEVQRPLVL